MIGFSGFVIMNFSSSIFLSMVSNQITSRQVNGYDMYENDFDVSQIDGISFVIVTLCM